MSLWDKVFGGGGQKVPALSDSRFSSFLRGWAYELRSSAAPAEALLDETAERFFEHFPDAFDEPTANQLLVELTAWTERFFAEQKAAEASWVDLTANDRLSLAFKVLRERGFVAREDAGISIQDGWAEIGLHQRRHHKGAVFFHQQDIFDAIGGKPLLLAFGTFAERPNAPSAQTVGQAVIDALVEQGFSPSWSGEATERIALALFPWQKRRWTRPPQVSPSPGQALTCEPLSQAQRHSPEALHQNAHAFTQRVTAVRSSAGFNVALSEAFEALWTKHGGVRGQFCHVGDPHTFVRAGEQTEVGVCNALLNLEAAAADALRRRARRIGIKKERQATVRAAPWPRALWTPGGAPGQVSLIVVSASPLSEFAADASPVDLAEWSPFVEVTEHFQWVYRDRETDPERFANLEAAARLAHEKTSLGPSQEILEQLRCAQFGALVHAEVPDPSDLSYLQFGWAVARWLLERADGAVLDTHSGRWWSRDELVKWEAGGWPTGRRFLLERELRFVHGVDGPNWVIGTQGLAKFGRPDFLCSLPAERLVGDSKPGTASIPAWVPESLDGLASKLALGASLQTGDLHHFGSQTLVVEPCRPGVNAPHDTPEHVLILALTTK